MFYKVPVSQPELATGNYKIPIHTGRCSKIHRELFYIIPSTVWCFTKYHWKSFYKIPVINSHWVVFHKKKILVYTGRCSKLKSNSFCKNGRVIRTVKRILISMSTKSQRWQRWWMFENEKHMIARFNYTRGDHTCIFQMIRIFFKKCFNLNKISFNAFELTSLKCFVFFIIANFGNL